VLLPTVANFALERLPSGKPPAPASAWLLHALPSLLLLFLTLKRCSCRAGPRKKSARGDGEVEGGRGDSRSECSSPAPMCCRRRSLHLLPSPSVLCSLHPPFAPDQPPLTTT
jgi:hypothetical protein